MQTVDSGYIVWVEEYNKFILNDIKKNNIDNKYLKNYKKYLNI